MKALLLDSGADRGSLAAARALGRDGWAVGSGSPQRDLCARSRFVTRHHVVPAPAAGADAFVTAVNDAVADGGYEVVFSSDDGGVMMLSEQRERLGVTVPYGPHEGVRSAFDKLELSRLAEDCGLSVPAYASADDLGELGRGKLVVKPRLTFVAGRESRINAEVVVGTAEAETACDAVVAAGGEPFVQEHIDGGLMAVTVLRDRDGALLGALAQVAERTWPPGVGVSARAVTVEPDEQLLSAVSALLTRLEWFGLAQIQFLRPADGRPRLLDFNGRFYGSLALSTAAGLNLPASWARAATQRPPLAGPTRGRAGARYQWLSRDLRASAQAGQGTVAALLGAIATAPRATHSVWSVGDPSPAIDHYGRKVLSLLRRR